MPEHFHGLTGASVIDTHQFQLTARIIGDLVDNAALGVVHGPAGTGKTFAVESHLETLHQAREVPVVAAAMSFPSRPTMQRVALELATAITGSEPSKSTRRSRFTLIAYLIELLSGTRRLLVIDEAQRLNGDCIEMIRHLHDHKQTNFALLYVGGDGCWEVLSREPMLRSRVFRRLPFKPLVREQVPAVFRLYHPIYAEAGEKLLLQIDDAYAHGTLRDWAVFTHTAAGICRERGIEHVDGEVVANACALLGGGV